MSGENSVSSIVGSLGGGTGIDIRKLAEDLTNAERIPAEERLEALKDQTTAEVSAYAVLKYNVDELITKFQALDDVSELLSAEATSTDDTQIGVSGISGSASTGTHTFSVSALAAQQVNISNSYTSASQTLNEGSGFTINVTDGSGAVTAIAIADGDDTPNGIVAAINASGVGVSASLLTIDTNSDEYKIVLNGTTGSANSFVVSSTLADSDLGFHDASNGNSQQAGGVYSQQVAANSVFTVNGVSLERASNNVADALQGVVLDLKSVSASGTTTQIKIEQSQTQIKASLQALVDSYNATRYALKEISDPESTDEDVGGALSSDFAAIRQVRSVIYRAVTQNSSTASGSITALRDIGIELTLDGDLNFNELKFDTVMKTSADDVVKMLSAGTDNQSKYDGQAQGLARDAIADIEVLNDSVDGLFATRTKTSLKAIGQYESDLEELDVKMNALFDRYMAQFTVMESLVSQLNSTRTSLADTWMNTGNFNKK